MSQSWQLAFLGLMYVAAQTAEGRWLSSTTDGKSAAKCASGELIDGFGCEGRYCDDVHLDCVQTGIIPAGTAWTGKFSEEGTHKAVCSGNGFVTGLECTGSYCDEMNLYCTTAQGRTRKNCIWKGDISEEDQPFFAGYGYFIAGMSCTGSYCDNVQFYVCQISDAPSSPSPSARRLGASPLPSPSPQKSVKRWVSATGGRYEPAVCNDNEVMTGLRCSGSHCSTIAPLCESTSVPRLGARWWTDYFSEEASNYRSCGNDGFVVGIGCDGTDCDYVNLQCARFDSGGRKECFWTEASLSEESGKFVAPAGVHIAGVKCSDSYCDNLGLYLCQFRVEPTVTLDMASMAIKFAPLLRFDQEMGTGSDSSQKCFPSDPQAYRNGRKKGQTANSLCNQNYTKIQQNEVPAYYLASQIGTNTVAIRYWFFYAYQGACLLGGGSHDADWESVIVVLVNGALERVVYVQHTGHYTKNSGNFELSGTHPISYVGKNAHGDYHNSLSGLTVACLYFSDYRNPGDNDYKWQTWKNLRPITRGTPDAEEWMNCTDSCFDGIGHPIKQTDDLRAENGCESSGCDGSWSDSAALPIISGH